MSVMAKTGKYTIATLEYAGLVSVSYVKRSGFTIKICLFKMAPPVKRTVVSPFVYMKSKLGAMFTPQRVDEKLLRDELLKNVDERFRRIEERLAYLETHGAQALPPAELKKEKKKLTDDKRMLFKAILRENKTLIASAV